MTRETDLTGKLGSLVRYYQSGWRYGYLEQIKKATATIRPVSVISSNRPRRPIHVPVSDVESTL